MAPEAEKTTVSWNECQIDTYWIEQFIVNGKIDIPNDREQVKLLQLALKGLWLYDWEIDWIAWRWTEKAISSYEIPRQLLLAKKLKETNEVYEDRLKKEAILAIEMWDLCLLEKVLDIIWYDTFLAEWQKIKFNWYSETEYSSLNALHFAIIEWQDQIFEFLINKEPLLVELRTNEQRYINWQIMDDFSPLWLAIILWRNNQLRMLVRSNAYLRAHPSIETAKGELGIIMWPLSYLDLAMSHGNQEAFNILLDSIPESESKDLKDSHERYFQAIDPQNKFVTKMAEDYQESFDRLWKVEYFSYYWKSPLYSAIELGKKRNDRLDYIKQLLERWADINSEFTEWNMVFTPLTYAMYEWDREVVDVLLDYDDLDKNKWDNFIVLRKLTWENWGLDNIKYFHEKWILDLAAVDRNWDNILFAFWYTFNMDMFKYFLSQWVPTRLGDRSLLTSQYLEEKHVRALFKNGYKIDWDDSFDFYFRRIKQKLWFFSLVIEHDWNSWTAAKKFLIRAFHHCNNFPANAAIWRESYDLRWLDLLKFFVKDLRISTDIVFDDWRNFMGKAREIIKDEAELWIIESMISSNG